MPTNVKRTIAKPGRLRSGKIFLCSAISKAADSDSDVIDIETIEPENSIKSRKASAFEPSSTREVNIPPFTFTSTKPLDFGLPNSGIPDWFIAFQNQIAQQEQRLTLLEDLAAENKRLRSDLDIANQRIIDLESQLSTDQVPALNLDVATATEPGTEASKFATTDVPHQPAPQNSYAAAASRGKSVSKPKPTHRRKTTARQMEAIHRRFQPVASSHDYQYLYLPSRYREPVSSLRAKLHKLKINNARVLDVHYPDSQVVALLVHTDYIADVTAAFAVAKIEPLANFDPLDPALLRDPKFATLTADERIA